ncbi:FAD-dependent oxidoreductase [Paraburkholderia sediminicola]|uniref:FAD-dependent oxidoreductase n=1 Tax=Paraburkholderia sediminicola TaxID=458836 RepID=UPI0038B904AD
MATQCSQEISVPVLIVGGGPVGLAMAIELGWRDIDCLVLEEGDGSVDHPRLGAIMTRTLEFARRWGIADRIYNCGFNNDYKLDVVYCTSMTGHLLARDEFPSCSKLEPPQQSPEKRQRCPQLWFNPILEKHATEYDSVVIRHHCKVEEWSQTSTEVVVRATDADMQRSIEVHAQYVVACDGAGSRIRAGLDIPMVGDPALSYSVNIFIRSPELLKQHKLGEAERYIFVGEHGVWGNLTVVDGRDLWRITVIGSHVRGDIDQFDPHSFIRQALGSTDIPYEVISVKPWRRTELIASKFSSGRIFLAGDAAHTMSPTGGFGMNTGIGDVVDLGWKLDAVLSGWGGRSLLDSYEVERQPIARQAASISADNFRNWVSANQEDCSDIAENSKNGATKRAIVGGKLSKACHEEWDCLGVQLGYRYDDSPICVPDGTTIPPFSASSYEQTSRPGGRAPHAWIDENTSTLDLFGKGFVLLNFDAQGGDVSPIEDAASAHGVPLRTVPITTRDVAAIYERKFVLVRPDGHVAWRGDEMPDDPLALIDRMRGAVSRVSHEHKAACHPQDDVSMSRAGGHHES